MLPTSPERGVFDGPRITLRKTCRPEWAKSGVRAVFVPLNWREKLKLSARQSLEVFLLCRPEDFATCIEWRIAPGKLQAEAKTTSVPNTLRLAGLIYECEILVGDGCVRVNCPDVFKDLVGSKAEFFMVSDPMGVTIWTIGAYQEHHAMLIEDQT